MNKIFLIVKREYLTRVRKKSFMVMTILAPLLVVTFYGIIFYFAINKDVGESKKRFYVSDNSGLFTGKLHQNALYEFVYGVATEGEARQILEEDHYNGVIIIPATIKENSKGFQLFSKEQPGFGTVNYIEDQVRQEIKNIRLNEHHIDPKVIDEIGRAHV